MKTYRNEQHGFEIDIPGNWSFHSEGTVIHPSVKERSFIFKCDSNEAFHIQINPLKSELTLEQVEDDSARYAHEKGYTSLGMGRITVAGKEHVWARYYVGGGLWSKKYMIILNNIEYAITATCLDQKYLLEMEKNWDAVAASFRLLKPIDKITSPKCEVSESKNETTDKHMAETRNVESHVLTKSNSGGVKTYKNDELGIEIDVPESWLFPAKGSHHTKFGEEITFGCGINEAFYITIIPSASEFSLEQTELKFRKYASEKGYINLVFGRVTFENSEHVCVQYNMTNILWVKKYLIFLEGTKYEITASCTEDSNDRKIFEHKKKVWDSAVASFRVLRHIDDALRHRYEIGEQMVRSDNNLAIGLGIVGAHNVAAKSMAGMKTYRNEKHGFEIDIPEIWSPPHAEADEVLNAMYGPIPPKLQKDVFQYGCYDEAFNFEIAPLFPEPLLDDTEVEFGLYARDRDFKDLRFGRIMVAGKEHVCANYFIHDEMGVRWNKKYMVVFGGVEYALTATCNDPHWFAKREKDWDSIVQTFRPIKPFDDSANLTNKADRYRDKRREIVQERIEMRDALGDLYAKAYEAVSIENYKEAHALLEKCLQDNPDHVLAHKEMAVVLEKLGDKKGAITHRKVIERLDPSDEVNRSKLKKLLAGSNGWIGLPEKDVPVSQVGGLYYRNPTSQPLPTILGNAGDDSRRLYTLAFSIRSYLLIAVLSAIYINYKVGLKVLLSLTSEAYQPLSNFEFNFLSVILVFGIGAFICLMFLLGVAIVIKKSILKN